MGVEVYYVLSGLRYAREHTTICCLKKNETVGYIEREKDVCQWQDV